jgi:HNH endonuclease
MLTAKRLRQQVHYNPLTGIFTWKESGRGHRQQAGSLDPSRGNRIRIWIFGRFYEASRLAWLYVYGVLPEQDLDHKNGNAADNTIVNLRLATMSQNCQNKKRYRNNTSGYKGVSKIGNRWRAVIKDGPNNRHLGCFATPEEAYEVYKQAAQKSFGEFARFK